MTESERDRRTFEVAAQIVELVVQLGGRTALIGAAALAVHGYVRATRDIDLATELDPFTQMRQLEKECRSRGYETELALPDAEDPLGGVLSVYGDDFDTIQIVNFSNPLSNARTPATEAISGARPLRPESSIRVVTAAHLAALKLYAGGLQSRADVVGLLRANPELDRAELRDICRRHGLTEELELVLDELGD